MSRISNAGTLPSAVLFVLCLSSAACNGCRRHDSGLDERTASSPRSTESAPAASNSPGSPAPAQLDTTLRSASLAKVSYAASTATIPNPERGFYHPVDCTSGMSQAQLQGYRVNDGDSLILCSFNLSGFVNSPISQSMLDQFQNQMDIVRNAGIKIVLRFVYNFSDNATDAVPSQVDTHLNQLAPYLAQNKDVIAVVQAGLIGSWGEWANSINYGVDGALTAQNWTDRKAVLDKLLQVVPADRMVQLRTPDFKRHYYGPTALSAGEAFNGSAKARTGHHNDCFVSSRNDYRTYVNPSAEYPYLAAETAYLPMGGETCNYAPPRSDCPTALSELAKFHWSFLNADFKDTVLNGWKSQGCFAQVKQKLGYRFVLQSGAYSLSAQPGGAFAVNLTLQNQGWAAPYNSREVELVLRNTATGAVYRVKLAADPRLWLPGQTVTLNQNVTLPADLPKGNYAVLLNLPDPAATLYSRPEYAIQLANSNLWEANTGFNNLNHTAAIAKPRPGKKTDANRRPYRD